MQETLIPRIAFIYNPASGSGEKTGCLERFRSLLEKKWEFISVKTIKDQVAKQVKKLCDDGFNRIIVSGGDGTIMEVINGVMTSGGNPVIGIIPQGTGNDLAKGLGYYKRFREDRSKYLNDFIKNMETPGNRVLQVLALNDEVYFTNYMGIGFDAKIVREFHKRRESIFPNRLIYFFCILKNLFMKITCQVDISISCKGGKKKLLSVRDFKNILIINIPSFAGGLIKPDGLECEEKNFHLITIDGIPELLFFMLQGRMPSCIINCMFGSRRPQIYKSDRVAIRLPQQVFIQIDGEDYTERISTIKELNIKMAGSIKIFK